MSDALEIAALEAGNPGHDAELEAFFESCPWSFAQQTPAWRNVITRIDRDEPMFLGCRQNGALVGVLPAYRFAGPLGAILTSAPQAGPLGGIACTRGPEAPAVYSALLGAYTDLAVRVDCSLATVVSNPFWPDREFYASFRPDYVLENRCLALDLKRDVDAHGNLLGVSSHVRRHLRRAAQSGLVIDESQNPANVDAWYRVHAARHREIGATPLPPGLFTAALDEMVPRGKARFFFVREATGGEIVAGGFYVLHGGTIDALMPSVSSEFAKRGANYLLARHSIRWAWEQGLRFYNWQPSPPESGVYRFKKQWGSRDHDYGYFTRVTGDASRFTNSTPEEVRDGYRWHYVLPFDRIGRGAREDTAASSRKSAWDRVEGER